MTKSNPVNPNRPAATGESPRLGDDMIRALADAVAEILNVDHYIGSDGGSGYDEDAAGQHMQVTGRAQASVTTPDSGTGRLWFKTVGTITELMFTDKDGTEKQLTSAGKLNVQDADGAVMKTGDQTIAGEKTFSTFLITPSAAPDADYEVSNKKYVDDQVDTQNMTPATYAAEESVTFANGLIIKFGSDTIATDTALSFGTAFPNAVISINATLHDSTSWSAPPRVHSSSVSGFSIALQGVATRTVDWIAIGY